MFYSLPQANVLQEAGRVCVARLLLSLLYELKLLREWHEHQRWWWSCKSFLEQTHQLFKIHFTLKKKSNV